jgi:dTDP-4-dehydrorhamnose reductase
MNNPLLPIDDFERPVSTPSSTMPEVWAGIEPTVNRVGDRYLDQINRSGHAERIDDLDLFAELGIKSIRYPVLWERVAPNGLDTADWSWPDARLSRLRELGVRPIVGLIHHGSGPRDTSLVDPAFPERLATYAGAVARRYPWIEDYTPVNEPLTTARFSALYGHWYPHERNDLSFARALLGECRGVVLSMRAIREVNPNARLVQTEEVSRIHSTPALAYQAELENERRWLTYDLLSGELTEDRPMWRWLASVGVSPAELEWFLDNTCPPDILGVNYYLSGERFLDERVHLYPGEIVGGNGIDTYVDVLAARVLPDGIGGVQPLLEDVWDRYHRPMCISEAHNGDTREEQLRWLHDVWDGAVRARSGGADVRAVTVWALLGSYDWPTLVTRDDGVYEPGVFDLRAQSPRPTALARMTKDLATMGRHHHPVLEVPGWWRRPDRFTYWEAPNGADACRSDGVGASSRCAPQPVLVVGDDSALVKGLREACTLRHIPVLVTDARDPRDTGRIIEEANPWAVIFARSPLQPHASDSQGTREPLYQQPQFDAMVARCASLNVRTVMFSSSEVFDGLSDQPYCENCSVVQDSEVGRMLAEAEERWLANHGDALIVRTGLLFGPGSDTDHVFQRFPDWSPADIVSLTYIPDLADSVLDLLIDGERGVWHLCNAGSTTYQAFELVRSEMLGHSTTGAQRLSTGRPSMRALTSRRGRLLPDWWDAMQRYAQEQTQPLLLQHALVSADD